MPSLGQDLKSIREHLGYSVEDIRNATKLPYDTIHSIEDGSIFSDPQEINTYIRSFVRSYGRALKIDNDRMSRALDQEELGNYTDLLLQDFPELRGDTPEPETSKDKESQPSEKDDKSSKKKKKRSPSFTFAGDDEDEKSTDQSKSPSAAASRKPSASGSAREPDVHSIDWAGVGKGIKKQRTQPPVWLISAGLLIILLIAAAIIITQFGFFSSEELPVAEQPETTIEEPSQGQDLTLELSEETPAETEEAMNVALSDTLYLTVYAANGRLDPVRVWSDLKPRIDPYWLDQGTAFNFEFADSIRVAGNYSNMLLFLNGNRIENFRGRHFNPEQSAVELTRSLFDSDPEWATPVPLELPDTVAQPDTLMDRPSFP